MVEVTYPTKISFVKQNDDVSGVASVNGVDGVGVSVGVGVDGDEEEEEGEVAAIHEDPRVHPGDLLRGHRWHRTGVPSQDTEGTLDSSGGN